jgi:nicotinamide-nucleotide amidase
VTDDVMTVTESAPTRDVQTLAGSVAELAQAGGTSLAAAESLTGGAISAALAAAPSASSWFRGGVTAYATEVKQQVLGVPPGPVISMSCAVAMASGVARLMGADLAVAVTGVGGPDEQEGQPAGTVLVAVATASGAVQERQLRLEGDPAEIVEATTRWALELVEQQLRRAE